MVLRADGTFIYTPRLLSAGSDSFQYRVSDGKGGVATGTATITIHLLPTSGLGVAWWQDGRPLLPSGNMYMEYDTAVFSSATTLTAGPGVTVTEQVTSGATSFRITGGNATSLAAAQSNRDYMRSTFVVRPGVDNTALDGYGMYQFFNGTASMAMAVVDQTTGVETVLLSRATTTVSMFVSFAPYPLRSGRSYEVRLYIYNAPSGVSLDNPRITKQVFR